MRRRDLILLLASGAACLLWSDARAEEPGRVYLLGFISDVPRDDPSIVAAFDELRRSGFVEGQNLRVVKGGFSLRDEETPEVAARLVAAGVDVIWTGGYPRTRVAQQATRTIPIVTMADDLVLSGLVSSLSHPGGNTTGISLLATELDGKRQELLTELVPVARHIAALSDPRITAPEQLRALEDAARSRGIALSIYRATKPEEIIPAIDGAHASGVRFESNARTYPRRLPLAIAKADGLYVTDVEGRSYMDCLCSAGALALGHNVSRRLVQPIDFGVRNK